MTSKATSRADGMGLSYDLRLETETKPLFKFESEGKSVYVPVQR